jgi:hypothetical protein
MGVGVGRIEREYILRELMDKRISLNLHGNQEEVPCTIADMQDNELTLQVAPGSPLRLSEDDTVRLFFSFYEQTMTFPSRVHAVQSDEVVVAYPESMHKNLQRKYERVPPPTGLKVTFTFKGERIDLGYPKTDAYDPVERPQVTGDVEDLDLSSLVSTFREAVRVHCEENTIVMFRERKPATIEEKLVARSGRALYIPNTAKDLPKEPIWPEERIITKDLAQQLMEELDRSNASPGDALLELLRWKQGRGITAELYCPIVYHEYVVGYVLCTSRGTTPQGLNQRAVEYVWQFSKVLAYALMVSGYFKKDEDAIKLYDARIIDISSSGILFAHSSEQLARSVLLYTDLDLHLKAGKRAMRLETRVMRKFRNAGLTYYGGQFMSVKPEDFRFLFDFLYGRPITPEDEATWEGGAAPPPVDLFGSG